MDFEPLVPALTALAGGVVGVAGTAIVTWMSHRAARVDRRREDVQELAGELLAVGDAMWSTDQRVVIAVYSMTGIGDRSAPGGREAYASFDAERLESMRAHNEAAARARAIVGSLSLICPPLDVSAARYVEKSSFRPARMEQPLPTKRDEAARATAREEFVEAARAVLD